MVATVSCVSAIISAYHDGTNLVQRLRDARAAKKRQATAALIEVEKDSINLEKSLGRGPSAISEEYDQGYSRFGATFAKGDATAREQLKDIIISLQIGVLSELRCAWSDDTAVDYRSLQNASNENRTNTVVCLGQLYQRMCTQAPLKRLPSLTTDMSPTNTHTISWNTTLERSPTLRAISPSQQSSLYSYQSMSPESARDPTVPSEGIRSRQESVSSERTDSDSSSASFNRNMFSWPPPNQPPPHQPPPEVKNISVPPSALAQISRLAESSRPESGVFGRNNHQPRFAARERAPPMPTRQPQPHEFRYDNEALPAIQGLSIRERSGSVSPISSLHGANARVSHFDANDFEISNPWKGDEPVGYRAPRANVPARGTRKDSLGPPPPPPKSVKSSNSKTPSEPRSLQPPDSGSADIEEKFDNHIEKVTGIFKSRGFNRATAGQQRTAMTPIGGRTTSILLTLPSEDNNYAGFCKGAWKLQIGQTKKAMTLEFRPMGMYGTAPFWRCSKCSFEGAAEKAPSKAATTFDRKIRNCRGIPYRWVFLAKSHVNIKTGGKGVKLPMGDGTYGCIFCCAEGGGQPTPVFGNVTAFFEHLQIHRVQPPGSELADRTRCIVGRVASPDEDFDINLPPMEDEG
ncbi:MAG: hypothetical protein Q9227_007875 [Pyrenula ochraceoflavens]